MFAPSVKKWEKELEVDWEDKLWESIHTFVHAYSKNVLIQENSFKILTRWYRTPTVLHKIDPKLSDICWRGKEHTGSFLDVWWSCPAIRPFWVKLQEVIKLVKGLYLPLTPEQFLLHYTLPHCRYSPSSLVNHLLTAAAFVSQDCGFLVKSLHSLIWLLEYLVHKRWRNWSMYPLKICWNMLKPGPLGY